jgi:spore maturation protein CgeB
MRALVVHPGPSFSVADVHQGWIRGLRACGVRVAEYNLNDRLDFFAEAKLERDGETRTAFAADAIPRLAAEGIKGALWDWWPDLVVVISGFYMPPDLYDRIRQRRHRIVLVHTESPYEDDRQIARAELADLNVVNDPTNLDRFAAAAPTVYLPHAYNPNLHKPGRPDPRCASDFCFVGTGYPSRVEFLERVDWEGVDVAIAGHWLALDPASPLFGFLAHPADVCSPNTQTVRLYQSTKMSANLYRKEATPAATADGWAVGPREVELAACGTFFAREPRPEGDRLFPTLPRFTSPGELGDLVRWYLARPDARQAAADAARLAVGGRTFENHAAELLRLVDDIPARKAG